MAQYKKVGNLKVRTDLSPEKQALVNEIAKNYVQQNKKIDAERRGNIVRGGKGGGQIHKVYIPFEPTQIKSVNNEGTFSLTNPNIYKAILGGLGASQLLQQNQNKNF